MLASHFCVGKPSCFKFAWFFEWCVEIWLFSFLTGAVMYCVPQGWKPTKLNVTDHALIKEGSLTLKRKALSMFDSPTLSHTGINVVPVRSSLAEHSWLSHRASERPLTPLTSLEQQQPYPVYDKSGEVPVYTLGSLGWGGVISDSFFGTPCCQAETASVLLQLREVGSKL